MPIKLSKTQQKILPDVLLGYSVNELASLYDMRKESMGKHLTRIYSNKGVKNRTELMAKEILRLSNKIRELYDEQRREETL